MLEYVFFHQRPFAEFVEFLQGKGLDPETRQGEDGYEVLLPEETDDGLSSEIEDRYDQLMELDRELFESDQEPSAENYQVGGVLLHLVDGRQVYADVDSDVLGRVMGVITTDELGKMVQAIVAAVESPDERTFCQRIREHDA